MQRDDTDRRIGYLALAIATCAAGALTVLPALASATPGAPGIDDTTPSADVDLAALQLTSAEASPIVKWPSDPPAELTVYKTATSPITGAASTSDSQCASAVYAGLDKTYDGTGYTGLNYQELTGFGSKNSYSVISVASSYNDEHAAANMVANTIQNWTDCSRKKVTGDLSGSTQTRTVNNVVSTTDDIYLVNNITDDGGACSHAMTSQGNVVVEVSACRSNIGLVKQSLQLANKMLVKLP
ncbi:sensor domain-containing protein [[Mycobacterium] holstebronense]|uniref:Sensor domain-containing protein n=1 Tax=[Mycobacterium] holstebronense TaxID=3064288 RepID=A0ABM9M6U9_9MYCO|nr:sensor domain-containing protein [Mycolicibacter sp. MU0102]CAJ1510889.1 sensor domain-containing protein [Mycolicibacter sp. MU0102]